MDDLRTLCEKYSDLDVEYKFASISEDLWKLGSIEKIKDEVSPETFTFHVAVKYDRQLERRWLGFYFL